MSFLKISDPTKRDLIVKEYLELKKNIRDNLLSERTGELNYKLTFQSFIDLLPKRKKLQRGRLRKDLSLLKKVSKKRKKNMRRKKNNWKQKDNGKSLFK